MGKHLHCNIDSCSSHCRGWSGLNTIRCDPCTQGKRGFYSLTKPSSTRNKQDIKRELFHFAFYKVATLLPFVSDPNDQVSENISIPTYLGKEQNIKKSQKTQQLADLPQYIICIAFAPSFQKAIQLIGSSIFHFLMLQVLGGMIFKRTMK